MNKRVKFLTPVLFVVCVLAAFFMRTWHYNRAVYDLGRAMGDVSVQELKTDSFLPQWHKNFSPFTIESAMMFSYARDIACGKGVPARDPLLNGLEDIPPYGQMIMGLEWFLGWGWKVKNFFSPDPEPSKEELRYQDHPRMAQWMSGQLRLWTSLTSGIIFLWLVIMGCPRYLSLIAGLLHAVSTAAIARSTGQDIVRGEFCFPLIAASIAVAFSIYRNPKIWKSILLFIVSFSAFATWDLCQLPFGAWAMCEVIRFVFGRKMTRPRLLVWGIITSAIICNAVVIPFHHVYSLWRCQVLWVVLPLLFLCFLFSSRVRKKTNSPCTSFLLRLSFSVAVFCILFSCWNFFLNTPEYASNYSHFSEAMHAKIQFWNEKPLNPKLLSYDARILWTPSMTSATWETANAFFPSLMIRDISFRPLRFLLGYVPLSLLLFFILLTGALLLTSVRKIFIRNATVSLMPILFTLGFLIGFVYIVRYHEFLIFYLSVSLALLCRDYRIALKPRNIATVRYPWEQFYRFKRTAKFLSFLPAILFTFLLFYEAYFSCHARRYYTGDVPMIQTASLIHFMRENRKQFEGMGVAAGMTTGPMFKAYVGTGVVMNPQFGIKRIRDATEEYLFSLYHGTEKDMAEYCRQRNVSYLIFVREHPDSIPLILSGQLHRFARSREELERLKVIHTANWIYSSRYIADALEIAPDSVYRLFYKASEPGHNSSEHLRYFRYVPFPEEFNKLSKTHAIFQYLNEESFR